MLKRHKIHLYDVHVQRKIVHCACEVYKNTRAFMVLIEYTSLLKELHVHISYMYMCMYLMVGVHYIHCMYMLEHCIVCLSLTEAGYVIAGDDYVYEVVQDGKVCLYASFNLIFTIPYQNHSNITEVLVSTCTCTCSCKCGLEVHALY